MFVNEQDPKILRDATTPFEPFHRLQTFKLKVPKVDSWDFIHPCGKWIQAILESDSRESIIGEFFFREIELKFFGYVKP